MSQNALREPFPRQPAWAFCLFLFRNLSLLSTFPIKACDAFVMCMWRQSRAKRTSRRLTGTDPPQQSSTHQSLGQGLPSKADEAAFIAKDTNYTKTPVGGFPFVYKF